MGIIPSNKPAGLEYLTDKFPVLQTADQFVALIRQHNKKDNSFFYAIFDILYCVMDNNTVLHTLRNDAPSLSDLQQFANNYLYRSITYKKLKSADVIGGEMAVFVFKKLAEEHYPVFIYTVDDYYLGGKMKEKEESGQPPPLIKTFEFGKGNTANPMDTRNLFDDSFLFMISLLRRQTQNNTDLYKAFEILGKTQIIKNQPNQGLTLVDKVSMAKSLAAKILETYEERKEIFYHTPTIINRYNYYNPYLLTITQNKLIEKINEKNHKIFGKMDNDDRKKIAERLQKSTQWDENIFEGVGDPIFAFVLKTLAEDNFPIFEYELEKKGVNLLRDKPSDYQIKRFEFSSGDAEDAFDLFFMPILKSVKDTVDKIEILYYLIEACGLSEAIKHIGSSGCPNPIGTLQREGHLKGKLNGLLLQKYNERIEEAAKETYFY